MIRPFALLVLGFILLSSGEPLYGTQCSLPTGTFQDTTVLERCLAEATAPGGDRVVELAPGQIYWIDRPWFIDKSHVTITTAGLKDSVREDCRSGDHAVYQACAALMATHFLIFPPNKEVDGNQESDSQRQSMIYVGSKSAEILSNVDVHHLILDGSRQARLDLAKKLNILGFEKEPNTAPAACSWFNCANFQMRWCDGCSFRHNVSQNAVPRMRENGYANVFFDSEHLTIYGNLIKNIGNLTYDPKSPDRFDRATPKGLIGGNGLEVLAKHRDLRHLLIAHNVVLDASDGGIVVAIGNIHAQCPFPSGNTPATCPIPRRVSGQIRNNYIKQTHNMMSGAGILLYGHGTFGPGHLTDPNETLIVSQNTIDCNVGGPNGVLMCPIGIQLGLSLWDNPVGEWSHVQAEGGRVTDNGIDNAQIGINIDGTGTRSFPTYVLQNRVRCEEGQLCFNLAPGNIAHVNMDWFTLANGFTHQWGTGGFYGGDRARPGFWGKLETSGPCYSGACPYFLEANPKLLKETPSN